MKIHMNVLNKKIKDLFSLDYLGNFSLSSTFRFNVAEKKKSKKRNITFYFWKM